MAYRRLFAAARTGNVKEFHQLLQENPLIITDAALGCLMENPLHVAVKAGQLEFVCEITKHKPELARELNGDGFRPMDIAAVTGNVEMVRELLKVDDAICRLKGNGLRTALHYAAVKGRVEIIEILLTTSPQALTDVTIHKETALHLAVKNSQFEAFMVLVHWLGKFGFESVVNWGDCEGNTVLHLAASRKQLQSIEVLLDEWNATVGGILDMNATNSKGLTPTDISEIDENHSDLRLKEIMPQVGAMSTSTNSSPHQYTEKKQTQHHSSPDSRSDWFKYFKFQLQRDSPSETRNALLVVAALITTVTFQAGMNPPSWIVQLDTSQPKSSTNSNTPPPPSFEPAVTYGLAAISATLGTQAEAFSFVFGNTLGLSSSLSIIIYLTGGFPFQRELSMSIFCMMFCYGFSISRITSKKGIFYTLLSTAFVLPFCMRWLPKWGKGAWKRWRQRSATQALIAVTGQDGG